eukprot:201844_1
MFKHWLKVYCNYNNIAARILFLLLVFFLFAFAEELPTTAFGLVLTQDLDVSPSIQTWYYTSAFTTFSFQPLFGLAAQFLSLYTCCKQKFFAICGIVIGGTMYITIGSTKPNFIYLFIFTIILNVGLAFCNAIIDGISVEISNYFKQKSKLKNQSEKQQQNNHKNLLNKQQIEYNIQKQDNINIENDTDNANINCCHKYFHFGSAASIQSLSYFFRSCGSLTSSGMLLGLTNFDNYSVITLTGIIYLSIVMPFLFLLFPETGVNLQSQYNDKQDKKDTTLKNELKTYWRIITQIWRCLIFVFVLNIPPTITDVFYTFIYSRYYFTNEQYRIFKFMALCGEVLGGLIYFLFLAKYCENKRSLTWIFVLMQIFNCAFGFTFVPLSNLSNSFENDESLRSVYGIPFGYYISVMLLMDALASSLVLMPQLTLAAQMSPLRLETSVFACFIGISHLGELVSSAISSGLLVWLNVKESHWNNLTLYTIISSVSGLLPLFGLILLKRVQTDNEDNEFIFESKTSNSLASDNNNIDARNTNITQQLLQSDISLQRAEDSVN